jgi:tetratricopeptide (TPR) repeat protein
MSRRSKKKSKPEKTRAVHLNAPVPAESKKRLADLNGRWTVVAVCLVLVTMTWLVFGQTLGHDFVNYDDKLYVADNPAVLGGLSLQGIVWAFTHNVNVNWTPLTVISHMLDCQLYGTNAGWHHLTSVLLHMASAIVLFLVLKEMTDALWRSAFVAAVFAVHPLHVESVAWIAERRDVLSGLFFMLTLGAYVGYARRPWSPVRYGLVVLLFALGLMSKPMLVTLPFVLLLLDYWPLKRFSQPGSYSFPWRLVAEKIPLLVLSGAACAATLFAQKKAIQSLPLSMHIGNALVSYVIYLKQMIYPVGLAVYYPYPGIDLALWKIIAAFILLLAISAGSVAVWRSQPWFLFGWLWYLVMLVPVIGLIQSGLRAHADRYTYLPQIGLYVLLAWAAADLCAGWRHRRWVLGGITTVILAALIFRAHAQTSYWRNSESLWTHTLACTSDNADAHLNLGNALLQKGNVDEAIAHFQKALQINPRYADAHNNFGNALSQKGNMDEAIAHYQQALQIDPNDADAYNNLGNALFRKGNADEAIKYYQSALQINPGLALAHLNLGNALFQKGNIDEAITHFQTALQIDPDNADACYNLGNALFQRGNMDEAVACYQSALQINPALALAHLNLGNALFQKGSIDEAISHYQAALQINPALALAHNNLGNALLQKGSVGEAIAHYQMALQINPGYAEAQNSLAWLLATSPQTSLRNGNRAVELARQANQLTGGENPVVLRTLAAAYAEVGRFPEAVQTAQRALQLAGTQPDTALADALRSQMKLYQAGLPFHSD